MSKRAKIILAVVVLVVIIVGVAIYINKIKVVKGETKLQTSTLEDGTEVMVDVSDPTKPQVLGSVSNDGLAVVNSEVGEDTISTRK